MSEAVVFAVSVPLVFLLAAIVQSVTGFGSALVIVPLLTFTNDAVTAVVAATAAGWLLAVGATVRERHHVDLVMTRGLGLAGLWGMPFGICLLVLVEAEVIGRVIGAVLLGLVLLMLLERSAATELGSRATRFLGVLSGALLTSTGMNGPPLVLALRGSPPRRMRATLQSVFVVQDGLALVLLAVVGQVARDALLIALVGALTMPLGWYLGDRLFTRLSPRLLRHAILGGLVATATAMLLGT